MVYIVYGTTIFYRHVVRECSKSRVKNSRPSDPHSFRLESMYTTKYLRSMVFVVRGVHHNPI